MILINFFSPSRRFTLSEGRDINASKMFMDELKVSAFVFNFYFFSFCTNIRIKMGGGYGNHVFTSRACGESCERAFLEKSSKTRYFSPTRIKTRKSHPVCLPGSILLITELTGNTKRVFAFVYFGEKGF